MKLMSWMLYRYIMGELLRVFALSATVLSENTTSPDTAAPDLHRVGVRRSNRPFVGEIARSAWVEVIQK